MKYLLPLLLVALAAVVYAQTEPPRPGIIGRCMKACVANWQGENACADRCSPGDTACLQRCLDGFNDCRHNCLNNLPNPDSP
jgi:hypothetical protein